MHTDLLAKSPLLVLPVVAMLLFLAVWIVTTLHTLTRPRAQMEAAARMPLRSDDGDDHERT